MSSASTPRIIRADRGDDRERLDRVLLRHLADRPDITRARIQGWIGEGLVRVNGAPAAKPAARPSRGDRIEVLLPPPPERREILAQEIPLAVLFEDDHLLALDKPPGVVVHPAPGHHEGTLINALLWRARGWEAGQRPGLVNRLDRDTSGVLLVAKRAAIHAALTRSLRSHHGEKDYLALIYGATPGHGRIELRILRDPDDPKRRMTSKSEGKESVTLYRRIGEGGGLTLLGCRLVTGRTHQIRVHLQAQGWPIVGDPLYGEPRWKGIADEGAAAACRGFGRQALHARRLSFLHPATGERVTIVAPLPEDLTALLAMVGIPLPAV